MVDRSAQQGAATRHYRAGKQALENGHLEEAIQQLELARSLDEEHSDICYRLGLAYYHKEDWAAALAMLRLCAQKTPPDGALFFLQGICLLKMNERQSAVQALETAAAVGHLEAHFQLALLHKSKGRWQEESRRQAIAHLEAIIQATETGAEFAGADRVFFGLGQIHAEREDTQDKAIAAFRKGIAINPLSPIGHHSLGVLLLARGQILGALGEFKVAIQLDPGFPRPYTHLARVLFHHIKPEDLAQEYAHIIAEFEDQAAMVLARLSQEMAALSRDQVYQGLYTKGHQLKNLMGIMGSRLRRQSRKAEKGPVSGKELTALVAEHDRLYQEWVGYLNTLQPEALEPALTDGVKLVRRVLDAIKSQRGEKGLALRVQQGVPQIEVDERLIREVITNLCLNAIDAVDERGGEINVGVGYDSDKARVFIEVEDNGPGIPLEMQDHIFEPGFTTKEQGNGYGLSIARRIVQAHRGELRVKSRVKHGTVFRVDLPVNFETIDDPMAGLGRTYRFIRTGNDDGQ